MKTKNLLLFLVVALTTPLAKAQSVSDVFDPKTPISWLGWDFSRAKFVGIKESFGDVKSLMSSWNDLMSTERAKFNIPTMLGKKTVDYKFDVTKMHNAALDVNTMFSEKPTDKLQRSDIEAIAHSYDYQKNTGIGLMFNIESFNKQEKDSKMKSEATVWVTFVNMSTGDVLVTERMTDFAKGFGVRNYWAGAITAIMKRVQDDEFKKWKKKYK